MTVFWCRGCGMEDTRAHSACPSCGSALQMSELEWLNEGDEGDETVFEIEATPIERAAIVESLMAGGIRHRWEGTSDLVVADINADKLDSLLDDILGLEDVDLEVDELEDLDQDGIPDFDEGPDNGYEVLSHLFIATDGLHRGRNVDSIEEFSGATDDALATPTPFGIDDETWADIQSAAKNISAAINTDASAGIDADIKALHNLLATLV